MSSPLNKFIEFLGYKILPYDRYLSYFNSKKTFSQCGEDIIVQYIFNLRNTLTPSYIDIGANHPYFLSNTALFYLNGCKGINIDANPELISHFIKERPKDINLNIGVGNVTGEMDFYIMKDNTLSTFSKEEYQNMLNNNIELNKIQRVKLDTLQNTIEKYCNGVFPDFLSIDVEGLDDKILKSIDFQKSSPKVICVEAAEYSPIGAGKRKVELIKFLESKNYYEYANTNLNAIMVRKDFWFI